MRKARGLVAVAFGLMLCGWQVSSAQDRVADFRFTVEPSASGAKAECALGCQWKNASFGCRDGNVCAGQFAGDAFLVRLQPDANGASAQCVRGCAWTKLSFGCGPSQTCRATIDSSGVRVSPTVR